MTAKQEFLQRELAWVRIVRNTTRADQLHMVEPAVEREREILAQLAPEFGAGAVAMTPSAVNFSRRSEDPADPKGDR